MKYNFRLSARKADIYEIEPFFYDAAVVFCPSGYTGLSAGLHFKSEKIAESKIGYIIYVDKPHPWLPYYKGWENMFSSQEEIANYIHKMVFKTLDVAYNDIGHRIAFCGIWIRYMDKPTNETLTAKAVSEWLDLHPDAYVTLIDKTDCFNRHKILSQ